jgi:hypothetical protein
VLRLEGECAAPMWVIYRDFEFNESGGAGETEEIWWIAVASLQPTTKSYTEAFCWWEPSKPSKPSNARWKDETPKRKGSLGKVKV